MNMTDLKTDHWNGFEKERIFHQMLDSIALLSGSKAYDILMSIIQTINPEWAEGLFETRPCERRLRYVGNNRNSMNFYGSEFFVVGKEYKSLTFNGGSYTILGYPSNIGCHYFEIVPES